MSIKSIMDNIEKKDLIGLESYAGIPLKLAVDLLENITTAFLSWVDKAKIFETDEKTINQI